MAFSLSLNEDIIVMDCHYTVQAILQFQDEEHNWTEYLLRDATGYERWLCATELKEFTDFIVYDKYYIDCAGDESVILDMQIRYTKGRVGTATVTESLGETEFQIGETCDYVFYPGSDEFSILKFTRWEGEANRISRGNRLYPWELSSKWTEEEKKNAQGISEGNSDVALQSNLEEKEQIPEEESDVALTEEEAYERWLVRFRDKRAWKRKKDVFGILAVIGIMTFMLLYAFVCSFLH